MALIMKCDRCGISYEPREETVVDNLAKALSALMRSPFAASVYVEKMTERVDLCEDCRASLKEWFRAGDKSIRLKKDAQPGPTQTPENAEHCCVCGEVIPEGRQVCPWCACGINNVDGGKIT